MAPAGMGGLPGDMGAFGGGGGMGGMDMGAALQMMQQPEYQQAMQQMLQSPGMLDAIGQMNPQLRGVLDNPQARSVLSLVFSPARATALRQVLTLRQLADVAPGSPP